MKSLSVLALAAALLALPAAAAQHSAQSLQQSPLQRLAEAYVDLELAANPALSYVTGLEVKDHVSLPDNRPEALRVQEAKEDALYAEFRRVDAKALNDADAVTHALLKEELEASRGLRACRWELWGVNHMFGWQSTLTRTAAHQPVGSPERRADALKRLQRTPAFIDVEISNLRAGLAQGWSSPKPVVARVIKQIEGLVNAAPEASPFFSPAQRDGDSAFQAAFTSEIRTNLQPALTRYRDFLQNEYLPKARDSLAVTALPNGAACYQAQLRSYTTLNRTPQQVHDIGKAAVERNRARVLEIGQRRFGTSDLQAIIAAMRQASDNKFGSEEELVVFSRQVVEASRGKVQPMFTALPPQVMVVEPFRPFQRGSGLSSHYERSVDPSKPATYRIKTETYTDDTRGGAEITAVHEGWPGHHLQIASTLSLPDRGRLTKLAFNSAYTEGWARYSEMLSEEAGIYSSDYALIERRLWPANGMMADPGIHALGWTRQQAVDFLVATGKFDRRDSEDLVDRIAILPGQLTAYDTGGLEIMALREEAKAALGPGFDIRGFHDAVLGGGVLPLAALRQRVETWIAAQKSKAAD
jgi:uncharacterized protein (DUF885 family)